MSASCLLSLRNDPAAPAVPAAAPSRRPLPSGVLRLSDGRHAVAERVLAERGDAPLLRAASARARLFQGVRDQLRDRARGHAAHAGARLPTGLLPRTPAAAGDECPARHDRLAVL